MSYVDAYLNRDRDQINIVERIDGKRVYKTFPTTYRFYHEDKDGDTLSWQTLSKFETTKTVKKKRNYMKTKIREADLNPFGCLEENYPTRRPIYMALFDIEVTL